MENTDIAKERMDKEEREKREAWVPEDESEGKNDDEFTEKKGD